MLEVKALAVSYGRHRALEGVGLTVGKGEICVILGANGAGKSTLLKAIAGMVASDAGEVTMNGRAVTRLKPHRIVEEGIALVPEGRGIFGDLSVAENLQLGAFARRARHDEAATLKSIYDLFPRLAERKRQVARTMSGGEQQMVAIGRALMSKPEILMLDEPSLGLSPILTQELFRSLTDVAATGVGILLVEQNAKQSLRIAKRGYLIENGHVTGENSAERLRNDPAVIAAYLGGAGGGRAARPTIQLPPSTRMPASVAAIGRVAGDLAARAALIQAAFTRAMRRADALPSAFVGRYDPKAGDDPWAIATPPATPDIPTGPPTVAPDARWLASSSANLAARASGRLAEYIASSRRSAAIPSAFQRPVDVALRIDELAQEVSQIASTLNGSHGLIGHNSAAAGIEPDDDAPAEKLAPVAISIADLVARAADVQKRHVEASRKALTAFTLPPPPPPSAVPLPRERGRIQVEDDRDAGSSPAERGRGTTRSVVEGVADASATETPAIVAENEPARGKKRPGKKAAESTSARRKKSARKGKKRKAKKSPAHQEEAR